MQENNTGKTAASDILKNKQRERYEQFHGKSEKRSRLFCFQFIERWQLKLRY